jgi:hypothetical protein
MGTTSASRIKSMAKIMLLNTVKRSLRRSSLMHSPFFNLFHDVILAQFIRVQPYRWLIALFLCVSISQAEIPQRALLLHVKNNSLLHVAIENHERLCIPYGIETFETMLHRKKNDRGCHKAVDHFYRTHPNAKVFGVTHLYLQQYYPVEVRSKRCIISASGKKSYAQLLLENGLATLQADFSDKRFVMRYRRAQNNARETKSGLWDDAKLSECMQQ